MRGGDWETERLGDRAILLLVSPSPRERATSKLAREGKGGRANIFTGSPFETDRRVGFVAFFVVWI
jgi:hypothetical protein